MHQAYIVNTISVIVIKFNSLTAMDGHDRPLVYKLHCSSVTSHFFLLLAFDSQKKLLNSSTQIMAFDIFTQLVVSMS